MPNKQGGMYILDSTAELFESSHWVSRIPNTPSAWDCCYYYCREFQQTGSGCSACHSHTPHSHHPHTPAVHSHTPHSHAPHSHTPHAHLPYQDYLNQPCWSNCNEQGGYCNPYYTDSSGNYVVLAGGGFLSNPAVTYPGCGTDGCCCRGTWNEGRGCTGQGSDWQQHLCSECN